MSQRRFTKEFKVGAAHRLLGGESASALARELDVKRAKLYDWAVQLERLGVFAGDEWVQGAEAVFDGVL